MISSRGAVRVVSVVILLKPRPFKTSSPVCTKQHMIKCNLCLHRSATERLHCSLNETYSIVLIDLIYFSIK